MVLEVGCGRGEYTTGLAALFPEKNFVGIDIKGARLWKGSQVAIAQGLQNAGFLRIQIQNLLDFFAEEEASEIWLTFPDPRPKEYDERRRLTHPRFLAMYAHILREGGIFHFKTDDDGLFAYTLEQLAIFEIEPEVMTQDLYHSALLAEHYGIRTTYEQLFSAKGRTIKYLRFRTTSSVRARLLQGASIAKESKN
ncbi:MAG: hypothetical protein OHK0053_17640 [Microscillaceae bacterium]